MVSELVPGITRRALYRTLCEQLSRAKIPDAALEVQFLIEECTGTALPQYLLHPDAVADPELTERLAALCAKRCTGHPLQYLLGNWDFYGLTFYVGDGVLIPRADTETLVDTVLSLREGKTQTVLLDLCSGSGCIPAACAAMLGGVTGAVVEKSPEALPYLKKNLSLYAPQLTIVQGDVLAPETPEQIPEPCDILTCNPPYLTAADMQQLQREVTFEPACALYGGTDGLDFYRRITTLWQDHIRPGGWLVYEIGMGQEADVLGILEAAGFCNCFTRADAAGILRVVAGQR